VIEFLKDSKFSEPHWFWLEPVVELPKFGAMGGRKEFQQFHFDHLPEQFPQSIDEARVFWADGMLHGISTENGGCRWVEFRETADESGIWETIPKIEKKDSYQIVLRRDWERFGSSKPDCEYVSVIEYWKDEDLFAWRILPE